MADLVGRIETNELQINVKIVGSGPPGKNGKDADIAAAKAATEAAVAAEEDAGAAKEYAEGAGAAAMEKATAAETAADRANNAAGTAEDAAAAASSAAETATAAAEDLARRVSSGEFDGTPGKNGITPTIGDNGNWYLDDTDTGKPSRGAGGYTPVKGTDYFTDEDKAELVAAVYDSVVTDVNQLKDDISNKLPKSPADWGAWTAEEQAAARDRIGIPGDYELIHDETITEDITQYTIDNISLKKVIMLFYSVSYTSDNYLLLHYNLAEKGITSGSTIKAINKNGYVSKYYAYFDGGAFQNFSVGPSRAGGTTGNLNTYLSHLVAERITRITLGAYTQSEIIPAGCRIKIYGVRA